jgi:hypothetical protein
MNDRITDIKSRLAAVVPGPWHVDPLNPCDVEVVDVNAPGDPWSVCTVEEGLPGDDLGYAHAAFIAHAPADLTFLLAEVARLQQALSSERDATVAYLRECELSWYADAVKRGEHVGYTSVAPVLAALDCLRVALDAKDVPAAKLALESLRTHASFVWQELSRDPNFTEAFMFQVNRPEWDWPYELPETLDHDVEVDAIIAALDKKDPDEARRRMKQMQLWDKVHGQQPSRETGRRLALSILRPEWNGGTP